MALVAAKSAVDDWSIPGAPSHVTDASVDELAYFDALIADITNRFPISENRLLVTGFSAGGMMVWNLACYRGERFAGFVPIAGTFWAPLPDACPSDPVNLFHIHGTSDSIVPLSGRAIEDAHQGDVHKALALLARQGRFGDAERLSHDELSCERRVNPAGRVLEFCTHPGGHSFSAGYIRRAWQALQARGAL